MIPEDLKTNAAKFLTFFTPLVKVKVKIDFEEIELLNKFLLNSDMEMKRTLVLLISRTFRQKTN